jgi:hypothetical protein
LKEIKKDATGEDVKKEISLLRTTYRNQLKTLSYSKLQGIMADDVYQPIRWTLKEIDVLNKSESLVSPRVLSVASSGVPTGRKRRS